MLDFYVTVVTAKRLMNHGYRFTSMGSINSAKSDAKFHVEDKRIFMVMRGFRVPKYKLSFDEVISLQLLDDVQTHP